MNTNKLFSLQNSVSELLPILEKLPKEAPAIINQFIILSDKFCKIESINKKSIYTLEQATAYLGLKKEGIQDLMTNKKIKFFGQKKLVFFLKEELNNFVFAEKMQINFDEQTLKLEEELNGVIPILNSYLQIKEILAEKTTESKKK